MLLRPLLVLRTSSASFIVAADRQYFGYLALHFKACSTTLRHNPEPPLEVESYVKLYFRCRLYSCTNDEVNFPTGNRVDVHADDRDRSSAGDRVGGHAHVDVGERASRERAQHRQRGADLRRRPRSAPPAGSRARDELEHDAVVGGLTDAVPTAASPVSAPATRARADRRRPCPRAAARASAPSSCGSPAGGVGDRSSTRPVPSTSAVPPRRVDPRHAGVRSVTVMRTVPRPLALERRACAIQGSASIPSTAAPVSSHTIASPSWIPAAAVDLGGRQVRGAPHLRSVDVEERRARHAARDGARARRTTTPTISSRRRRRAAAVGDRRGRGAAVDAAAPARARRGRGRRCARVLDAARRSRGRSIGRSPARRRSRPCAARAPARSRWRRAPVAAPRASRRRTSSAVAPGFGLEEVGVLRRHHRAADPQALEPERVDEPAGGVAGRVGEHRAGVGAAGLVLAPPAHDLGDLGLGARRRRRRPRGTSAPVTTSVGAERRACGTRSRAPRAAGRCGTPAGGEVGDLGLDEHVGGLPPVAAGVHPHRAADAAGDARRRTRARCARRRRPVGPAPGSGDRAAGPRRVAASASRSTSSNSPSSTSREPGEPGVGDEQVRAPADHEERRHGSPSTAPATRGERVGVEPARTSTATGPPTR